MIRFMKQSYNLEDIRLLTYRRLQNMMGLMLVLVYFAMIYLGIKAKLKVYDDLKLPEAKALDAQVGRAQRQDDHRGRLE